MERIVARAGRWGLWLGLGLIVAVQVVGLIAYFQLQQPGYAWGGLLGSLLVALGLGFFCRRHLITPLNNLAETGQFLAADCLALSNALEELGQGDLTTRVIVQSQPVQDCGSPEAGPLVRSLNRSIDHLYGAAERFNVITSEPVRRVCYVGADPYLEGRVCAEVMAQAVGGKGEVAVTLGWFELAPLMSRLQGFESVIDEKYPDIRVVATVETTFDRDRGEAQVRTLLSRYPALVGIYVTDGAIPPGAARAVLDSGGAGRVRVIGHDLVDETVEYLKDGGITAILSQDLFAQGHDSVIHLFNHLVSGWRPYHQRLLTNLRLITCDSLRQAGALDAARKSECLAQPLRPAPRPLRIAVQNRDSSGVDYELELGTMAAAAELEAYNATVELIPGGTLSVQPIVNAALDRGYDAITVLAANAKDVSCLNRAVEAGIAIATYNSEPLSLRAWVASLADRAQELMDVGYGFPGLKGETAGSRPRPNGPQRASDERAAQNEHIIRAAIGYMQEHLESSVGVSDVAHFVALDPSYFCRLFTERTGRNPRDFLMDLRIAQAKHYLADPHMSVMDVSVALGYSPSYFSRLFKSRVGCTPGEYAQRRRGN
jgi:ABC-type sugar transport system substrate-binding protein/AraC-like DNA-binding protein